MVRFVGFYYILTISDILNLGYHDGQIPYHQDHRCINHPFWDKILKGGSGLSRLSRLSPFWFRFSHRSIIDGGSWCLGVVHVPHQLPPLPVAPCTPKSSALGGDKYVANSCIFVTNRQTNTLYFKKNHHHHLCLIAMTRNSLDFGQFYFDDDNPGDNDSCDSNHGKYVSGCLIVNTKCEV